MKVKVELTIEVDRKAVVKYLRETGNISEETPTDFVKTAIMSAGVGCLEERLSNSSGDYVTCEIIKTNSNW